MPATVQQLLEIDWKNVLIALAIIIASYLTIKKGLEEFGKHFGWEPWWLKNDRVHKELSEAVIAIKDELVALRSDVTSVKEEVTESKENRSHDREDSRHIRATMYDDLNNATSQLRQELINSVRSIEGKIDVLQKKIDDNELQKQIEKYRDKIFNFASNLNSPHFNPEKDHYDNIFQVYSDYEDLLHSNDLTNGQCEASMNVIRKHFEQDIDTGKFVETV